MSTLVQILVANDPATPMESMREALAVAGRGIEGDR